MALGGQYLTAEGRKNLHNYKYSGSDNSLIYKYVLTPMNNALIPLFPLWMAPNLITLIGLLITFVSYFVTAFYMPDFQGDAPTWVYVWCAVGLFAYQTLDNLDGKQARRTGTSSPLGLLFDHGCDALNCTVSTATFVSILQMGPTWKSYVMWACATTTFVFNTWEEYFTNDLYLPIINGPTEGILTGILCISATAVLGPSFWTEPAPVFGKWFVTHDLILLLTVGLAVCTVTTHSIKVFSTLRSGNNHSPDPPSFVRAVLLLLPYLFLVAFSFVWGEYSDIGVLQNHGRLFIWTFGLFAANYLTKLMISHLCAQSFQPYSSRTTILLTLSLLGVASSVSACEFIPPHPWFGELHVLRAMFAISLVSYLHLAVGLIQEVTDELNINCLTIPYPPKMG